MLILETRRLRWPDEAACAATARLLAGRPALTRAFVELRGPLGAGKTTFVRHLLRALGVTGPVKSPTYAVLEPYELTIGGVGVAVAHFDFYRFRDPQEWEDAGFRDVFAGPGCKLAEWPDRAAGLLPPPDLTLEIEPIAGAGSGGAGAGTNGEASGKAIGKASDEANDANGEPRDEARDATFVAHTPLGLELLP